MAALPTAARGWARAEGGFVGRPVWSGSLSDFALTRLWMTPAAKGWRWAATTSELADAAPQYIPAKRERMSHPEANRK